VASRNTGDKEARLGEPEESRHKHFVFTEG